MNEIKMEIKKQNFSWGELITVEISNFFSIVLFPETLKQIKNYNEGYFTDETKREWKFSKFHEEITLTHRQKRIKIYCDEI